MLDADLVVCRANRAYLQVTGRSREELAGRYIMEAFPGSPGAPQVARDLGASLQRVLNSREPDVVAPRRFGIPVEGRPGEVEERWWCGMSSPALGTDGAVKWIVARADDIAELMDRHRDIAVRYQPAYGTLNVCGHWYDVVDLPPDRYSIAIGDVLGHGLEAAAAMGMLCSALSAAIRAVPSPAQALEALGRYARAVDGALATTVAKVLIDPHSRLIIYSNAGRPPPILLSPDGNCRLLDQAADPPLVPGRNTCPAPRPVCPTSRGTPSCSTPTASSNAEARTSTSAWPG